jgi:hypothetical protein
MAAWSGPGWPEIPKAVESLTEPFQRLPKASFGGIPMSYYERLGPALEHEEMVLQWLRYKGCIAEPWGQALFPIAIQEALRECQDGDGNPVLLRWFRPLVFLIDAAQRPEIQLIDKHVDHPHRVVLSNVKRSFESIRLSLPSCTNAQKQPPETEPTSLGRFQN